MDGNKDEANRCVEIAIREINSANYEKAIKFLKKANSLYPSQRAEDLLRQVLKMSEGSTANGKNGVKTENVRQRTATASASSTATESSRTYTAEQVEMVTKIKRCKDYYEVLSVSKQATDSEIKKAYKKLALQLHPDKNSAPGAVEAFKAVGNAVSVLTDARKRKEYDMFGAGTGSVGNGRANGNFTYRNNFENAYDRGFEADISAEELFNMFFGGFPANRRRAAQQQHARQHDAGSTPSSAVIVILFIVLTSVLSSFFMSEPLFSLSQTSKYPIKRETGNLHIPYYVRENFAEEYTGPIPRLETEVEEEYVRIMKQNCYRERSYRESMMSRARHFGSKAQQTQAQNLKTPSCDNLSKIGIHRYTLY